MLFLRSADVLYLHTDVEWRKEIFAEACVVTRSFLLFLSSITTDNFKRLMQLSNFLPSLAFKETANIFSEAKLSSFLIVFIRLKALLFQMWFHLSPENSKKSKKGHDDRMTSDLSD